MNIKFDWRKIAVWMTAYLDIVAFALVGGYFFLKEQENETLQKTLKQAFLFKVLVFGVGLLITFLHTFGGVFSGYTSSIFYAFIVQFGQIIELVKIGAVVGLCINSLRE